jgi:hypothetical protein
VKVQMLAGVSGSRDGVDWPPSGGVLECSADEGAQLIAAGLAQPLEKKAVAVEPEKAVAPKPEVRAGLSKKNAV